MLFLFFSIHTTAKKTWYKTWLQIMRKCVKLRVRFFFYSKSTAVSKEKNPSEFAQESPWLAGKLLVAMPNMPDPRFRETVILLCNHNAKGAMGLIVNREAEYVSFKELFKHAGIKTDVPPPKNLRIHFGGPVESGRGFVLHSPEYRREETMSVGVKAGLTATVDILKDIAQNTGPKQSLLALGYAGWEAGQLDREILQNGWLHVDADEELIFSQNLERKWKQAVKKIGFVPERLTSYSGHA